MTATLTLPSGPVEMFIHFLGWLVSGANAETGETEYHIWDSPNFRKKDDDEEED